MPTKLCDWLRRRVSQVVRQRSAKPPPRVRIPHSPPSISTWSGEAVISFGAVLALAAAWLVATPELGAGVLSSDFAEMRPGKPAWDWIRAAFEKEKVSLPEFSTDEELIEPSSTLNVDMTATDEVRDASGAQRRARVLHAVFTTWRTKPRFTAEVQQWFLGYFPTGRIAFHPASGVCFPSEAAWAARASAGGRDVSPRTRVEAEGSGLSGIREGMERASQHEPLAALWLTRPGLVLTVGIAMAIPSVLRALLKTLGLR